jgi:hypothetical protein
MELQHFFLGLIGAIGALHLLASVGQMIGKLVPERHNHNVVAAMTAMQRSDWYVFFHCADLLGTNRASFQPISELHNQTTRVRTPSQKPVQRPRIQVRM